MFLVLVLSHGLSPYMTWQAEYCSSQVASLFDKIDGQLIGLELAGMARVNEDHMTIDQLEGLFYKIADEFAPIAGPVERTGHDLSAGVRQIKGQVLKEEVLYTLALNNGYNPDGSAGYETYVLVSAAAESMSASKEAKVRQELSDFLKNYTSDLRLASLYRGRIGQKLDTRSMISKGEQIFKALGGRIIEGIEEGQLVSRTGYSSLIENSLFIGEEKININVGLRYNEYEDATYLWLGTPVIFTSY